MISPIIVPHRTMASRSDSSRSSDSSFSGWSPVVTARSEIATLRPAAAEAFATGVYDPLDSAAISRFRVPTPSTAVSLESDRLRRTYAQARHAPMGRVPARVRPPYFTVPPCGVRAPAPRPRPATAPPTLAQDMRTADDARQSRLAIKGLDHIGRFVRRHNLKVADLFRRRDINTSSKGKGMMDADVTLETGELGNLLGSLHTSSDGKYKAGLEAATVAPGAVRALVRYLDRTGTNEVDVNELDEALRVRHRQLLRRKFAQAGGKAVSAHRETALGDNWLTEDDLDVDVAERPFSRSSLVRSGDAAEIALARGLKHEHAGFYVAQGMERFPRDRSWHT